MNLRFRTRKRYSARRMSVISDQTSASKTEAIKHRMSLTTNPCENFGRDESRHQLKRDSRPTMSDDEPVTDWIPEIPFWNVSEQIFRKEFG